MKSIGYKVLFLGIFAGLFIMACERNKKMNTEGNQMEADQTDPYERKMLEDGFTRVTVTTDFAKDGCAYLLEAIAVGETGLLQPLVLDDSCKEDGKVIFIKFSPSRAPQQGNCTRGSLVVISEFQFQ